MSFDRYKIYEGKSISDWARETGIKAETISFRLRHGWTLEKAISTKPLTKSEASLKYDIIGKTFQDRFGNDFVVKNIHHRDKYGAAYYEVEFLKTGYVTYASSSQIRSTKHGRVFDRTYPSVHGVGAMGYAYIKDNPKLFDVWRAMIARCYNKKNPSYKTYGAKGVVVCDRWKRFDYFLEDVCKLPGYDEDKINKGDLVLDKDIIDHSKMIYSPETCCFVTKSENTKESLNRRWKEIKCND